MSTLSSQGLIGPLAAHEVEDYCAHLIRLDRHAQTRRFGGQLSHTALTARAKLAKREAAGVLFARIDGHIRAAAELWAVPGVATSCELALSIESGFCDLELSLMERALHTARERGISRLIYMAGRSERLPAFPDGSGASPWRPWSDPDVWFCDLTDGVNDGPAPETVTPPPIRNIPSLTAPLHFFGRALALLGARGPMLLVGSLVVGAVLPAVAGAAYALLPVSAFLLTLGSFLAAGLGAQEARVRLPILVCVIAWLSVGIPLLATAVLDRAPLDGSLRGNALLSVLAPPVGSAAAIAAMLGLQPRLALLSSVLLTLAAPVTIPLLGALVHLDIAIDMNTLAVRLAAIIGLAGVVAYLMLRFPPTFKWLLPDQRAGTGLAVLGLIIVGLATAQGVRAHWLANPVAFERMVAAAFTVNFGLCALGAAAFWWLGTHAAATVGLLSGNRNVTLAWAVSSTGSSSLAEGYLAACVIPVLALPLLVRWGQHAVTIARRLVAGPLGREEKA